MIRLILLFTLIYGYVAISSLSFAECDKTKACFKTTNNCTVDTCEFGISWKGIFHNGSNFLEFEMVGNVYSDNGYILLGFSEDKSLGNDGIVGCSIENNAIRIISGFYDESDQVSSSFVPFTYDKNQDFLVTKDGDKLGGIFNTLSKRIFCRFQRRVTPNHAPNQLKDLAAGKQYYLIIIRGTEASKLNFENKLTGTLIFSNEPVDFSTSAFYALSGSSSIDSKLAKSHGILMIVAWILCSSMGIIIARYYKEMWPSRRTNDERVWFQLHRSLQATCVVLTLVAFILIFIHVRGYSQLNTFPFKVHPILGIIVTILATLNPLLALCRCKPSSSNRPWFNWIHFFIGTIAYCLSVPTIMIGLRLPAAGQILSKWDLPQWILIIFVVFQFLIEIILEIHGCFFYHRDKSKHHTYEMEIEEYQAALIANQTPKTRPLPPSQKGRVFRMIMLCFHGLMTVIVTIVLVVFIMLY